MNTVLYCNLYNGFFSLIDNCLKGILNNNSYMDIQIDTVSIPLFLIGKGLHPNYNYDYHSFSIYDTFIYIFLLQVHDIIS